MLPRRVCQQHDSIAIPFTDIGTGIGRLFAIITLKAGAMENLTPRELEVLRLIAAGKSTKQIAAQLGIAFKTAVTHRSSIMSKLAAENSAHLITVAVACGLLDARDIHNRIAGTNGHTHSSTAIDNHIRDRSVRPREEIEAGLFAALDAARQEYQKYRNTAWERLDTAGAAMGTSDGTLALRKANQNLKNCQRVWEEYYKALRVFNDFVLSGKLPPDMDHT